MANLREKIIEYYNKGYYDFCFSGRKQASGYIINIEARNNEERVELFYDPKKDKCIEKLENNSE